MRSLQRRIAWLMLACFSLQILCPSTALADDFFGRFGRMFKETYHGTPPRVCQDGAVEILAENIDWLEHHIDRYGTIVAKQPDIWGEARMTKHRDEYERIMHQELNQFKFKLNAAISQSDSSFVAQALALSAAASGESVPGIENAQKQKIDTTNVTAIFPGTTTTGSESSRFSDLINQNEKINIEPTIFLDQLSRYLNHLHELRRINEGDDTSDSPGYSMNLVRIPVSVLPGKLTYQGFGGEITVTAKPYLSDDLLPNTFRNLVVEDLVDQLGLPLVRVIEDFEGTKKRRRLRKVIERFETLERTLEHWSYGESPDDLEELDILIAPILDNETARKVFIELVLDDKLGNSQSAQDIRTALESDDLDVRLQAYKTNIVPDPVYTVDQLANLVLKIARYQNTGDPQDLTIAKISLRNAIVSLGLQKGNNDDFLETIRETMEETESSVYREMYSKNNVASASSSGRARRARHPIPPSQVVAVYGPSLFTELSDFYCPTYMGRHVRWMGDPRCSSGDESEEARVNLLDIQKWLRAELPSAHELLSQPQHLTLWYELARPGSGLAEAIRSGHLYGEKVLLHTSQAQQPKDLELSAFYSELPVPDSEQDTQTQEVLAAPPHDRMVFPGQATETEDVFPMHGSVEDYRRYFFRNLHNSHFLVDKKQENYVLAQLAWSIVVESALLNERLNEDIRKTAIAKGCYCMGISDRDLTFFLPEAAAREDSGLSEEFYTATKAFQEYVNCRWPVHVFAVDPREQDQNVADVSARKREMQFALAVGFVTGQIGGNSLTQYSRSLEAQVETISLNRTIVGFGHGTDTFGWRFYPRVQALEVPGAIGTVWQSIAGVDQEDDVCHRNLEPGMRECVAIVLMPSFVPYCDFTTRSNWFRLTNPKNAALTMKHTLKLSKAITAMRQSKAQCARCAHCYRPGEIDNLMTRVEQLDRELPLQSMRALVPYENTLGGFEMFNTGVTDLSPELTGWYGAPGVVITDCKEPFACGCFDGCNLSGTVTCGTSDPGQDVNKKIDTLSTNIKELTKAVQAHTAQHPTTGPDKQPPLPTCEGAGTTLFLVGDNFSVHDSKVIAGGVCIPHVRLISREIMRVTIPSCVKTVWLRENGKVNEYVAIYLATPYGVTNHLHVPVHRDGTYPKHKYRNPCEEPRASIENEPPATPAPAAEDCNCNACNTLRLIPLPPVGDTHVRTVAMETSLESEDLATLTNNLAEATNNLASVATAQAEQPKELIVNVQSNEASTQAIGTSRGRKYCDGPLAKQMCTRVRECWHNLRDKLPCY